MPSDNPLRVRKNILQQIHNKIISIDDQIKDDNGGKLQYHINRKASKRGPLISDNIDKYEYLTGRKVLPSNQKQIIEIAKFNYFHLEKAFEEQDKTIKDQGKIKSVP